MYLNFTCRYIDVFCILETIQSSVEFCDTQFKKSIIVMGNKEMYGADLLNSFFLQNLQWLQTLQSLMLYSCRNIFSFNFKWLTSGDAVWISTGLFTVDSFFLMAGILLVYTSVGKLSGGRFRISKEKRLVCVCLSRPFIPRFRDGIKLKLISTLQVYDLFEHK